jgi:hypothetical protein
VARGDRALGVTVTPEWFGTHSLRATFSLPSASGGRALGLTVSVSWFGHPTLTRHVISTLGELAALGDGAAPLDSEAFMAELVAKVRWQSNVMWRNDTSYDTSCKPSWPSVSPRGATLAMEWNGV